MVMCKSHMQRQRNGLSIYCDCGAPIPLMKGGHLESCFDCRDSAICAYGLCNDRQYRKSWCYKHYMAWYRGRLGKIATCRACGEPTGKEAHIAWYCDECRRLARNGSTVLSNNKRRRAVTVQEQYTREQILKLDGGVCYLCQTQVNEDWEIEHINPISRGGDDIVANVAVSHKICNRIKASKIIYECLAVFPDMKIPERWCKAYGNYTNV